MDLGLKDRVVLVAGASRGLGAATARQFAREGAKVVMAARSREALVRLQEDIYRETGSQSMMVLPTDLTQQEQVETLIHHATARFGGLDILVTNCGGPATGHFVDLSMAQWQHAADTVLFSVVRLIQTALPHLRRSPIASILTFSSNSARQPVDNMMLANSLRLAVVGLTKTLALELGGEGIRVNSILPAWTQTERVTEILTARAAKKGSTLEDEIAHQAEETSLGRLGTPEEFARAAVFLASPAVPFMTGVMLGFDGGIYKATL
ncbi:MAG: SDR family oxidoreductase [Anaerolineae bacterium]|nr:SDR family oxidoreductase [Anaerolineae bacterium]NUQ05657.1 SDR family oxidoreductase [Anaerolineae bacterium]